MKRIELTQGKYTFVDDEDFYVLRTMKWWAVNNKCRKYNRKDFWYAMGWSNGKRIKMHNFILNTPKGYLVDHKDGDGLNNCKNNLRVTTLQKNAMNQRLSKANTSGFKGVYFLKNYKKYRANIRFNKKLIYLGDYVKIEDAVGAYDNAAVKYFGEFAKTNQMLGLLN